MTRIDDASYISSERLRVFPSGNFPYRRFQTAWKPAGQKVQQDQEEIYF